MPARRRERTGQPAGPGGRWTDEFGSVLDLELHEDGRVSGTLRLARDGCGYKPREVTGTRMIRPTGVGIVGSVVGWPNRSSVTAWWAELDEAGEVLRTRWLAPTGLGWQEREFGAGSEFRRRAATPSRRIA